MTNETNTPKQETIKKKVVYRGAQSAPVYGLGFIGALVYFIQHATTFWIGVLGFFKALFWPAFLVYEMLKYLSL